MRLPSFVAVLLAAGVTAGGFKPIPQRSPPLDLVPRQASTPARPPPPPAGCNFNQSKLCWNGIDDISTNYYTGGPRTGRTVTYNLEIQNISMTAATAPDGRARSAVLAINGQIPGPTITADWGDTLVINVKNSMQHNGTSIHWHGIRMLRNFMNDGVNGVTECPIAPGDTKTYTFVAEQYGTSWYHSHYSAQYGDGTWGAIVIRGPATAEYDIDLGPVTLSDWFATRTAFQAAFAGERTGPPVPDNFLVGGKNVNPLDQSLGKRFNLTFTPGKKHRVRFINTSVDTFFRVSLDGHNMTIIQNDFVPVNPVTVQHLPIAIGQRYDVIIEANQPNATYWLRTWPQPGCGPTHTFNDGTGTANALVKYTGAADPNAIPTSTPYSWTSSCTDQANMVPYLQLNVDSSGWPGNGTNMPVSAPFLVNTTGGNVFRWSINSAIPMDVDFANPSVESIFSGDAMAASMNSIYINGANSTAYWVIQNLAGIPHPIHWHLHDGYIVSQGTGTFDAATAVLQWTNPPRRDVAMLPASGYLLLAIKVDNPGLGIMHCHIAWHVSEGLSLQIVERASEIASFTSLTTQYNNTCTRWSTWADSALNVYGPKTDSGLRKRLN